LNKIYAVFLLATLCSCSDLSSLITGKDNDSSGNQNIGCTQEYYQTMIGGYKGMVVLNDNNQQPRLCQWDLAIAISGESVLSRCLLRATTVGTVEQLTFYPDDIVDRYQCLDDFGDRTVTEPIGSTYLPTTFPGLDNSRFPVNVDFSKNTLVDRGPYFGDESVNTAFVYLFDGSLTNHVEQITVEGDGTLTLRDLNGQLAGTLIKE